MNITPKQALLQRSAQFNPFPKASARAERLARPQDLLGAPPAQSVEYNSDLAAALQGPDAVRNRADLSVPSGRINTLV